MGRYKEEQKLSEILNQFKNNKKIKKGINETLLKDCWHTTMGKYIEKYTEKVYYADGVLYVKLTSAALRQELSASSGQIKDKLNTAMGQDLIHRVVLR